MTKLEQLDAMRNGTNEVQKTPQTNISNNSTMSKLDKLTALRNGEQLPTPTPTIQPKTSFSSQEEAKQYLIDAVNNSKTGTVNLDSTTLNALRNVAGNTAPKLGNGVNTIELNKEDKNYYMKNQQIFKNELEMNSNTLEHAKANYEADNSQENLQKLETAQANYDNKLKDYETAQAYERFYGSKLGNVGKGIVGNTAAGTNDVLSGFRNSINNKTDPLIGANIENIDTNKLVEIAQGKNKKAVDLKATQTLLNLKTQASKDKTGKLQQLYDEITNGTYKGTAEDINKILSEVAGDTKNLKILQNVDNYVNDVQESRQNMGFNPVQELLANGLDSASRQTFSRTLSLIDPLLGDASMYQMSRIPEYQKALEEGADLKQAKLNSELKGITATGIEKLSGGLSDKFFGTSGRLLNWDKLTSQIGNNLVRTGVRTVGEIIGEGSEEVAETFVDSIIDKLTYKPEAKLATFDEMKKSFTDSIIPTVIMMVTGAGANTMTVGNLTNYYDEANDYFNKMKKEVNKSKLDNNMKQEVNNEIEKARAEAIKEIDNLYNNENSSEVQKKEAPQSPINELQNNTQQVSNLQQENTNMVQNNANIEQQAQNNIENDVKTLNLEKDANNSQKSLGLEQQNKVELPEQLKTFVENRNKIAPGLNVQMDDSLADLNVDGVIERHEDGTRTIKVNPYSTRSYEFVTLHEMMHDLENTKEYKELSDFVKARAEGQGGYDKAFNSVKNQYVDYYNKNGLNLDNLNIENETTNDMVARSLGNQDFLNELATEKPTVFKRMYNWIKNVLLDGQNTGKSFSERRADNKYLQELKSKFEKAYNTAYNQENSNKSSFSLTENATTDNQGRQLSEGQQVYFKDSKVRDENGNLKEMYHGTDADFNKFSYEYLGKTGTAYGKGFYFVDSKEAGESYGKNLKEVYLDIKKPIQPGETTMTKSDYAKLIKKLNEITNGVIEADYGSLNDAINEYDYGGDDIDLISAAQNVSGINNYEEFYKILRETLGYDGIIANNKTNGHDGNIIIAFNPNQIKNVDNLNPTESDDIRYSQTNNEWNKYLDENWNLMPTAKQTQAPQRIMPSQQELQEYAKKSYNEQIKADSEAMNLEQKYDKQKSNLFKQIENDEDIPLKVRDKIYQNLEKANTQEQINDIKKQIQEYKDNNNGNNEENVSKEKEDSLINLSKMTESDMDLQQMKYKQQKDLETKNERRFFKNAETSPIIAEQTNDRVNQNTYQVESNDEVLERVKTKLDNNGNKMVDEWRQKTKNFNSEDVALGAVLIERYQQKGDWNSAARTVEKLADMGTEAGRVVQMYSIFQRLSPETMAIYQQKELNKAFDELKKKKTGEWVENNKEKFQLNAEDTKFIYEQVEKAQQATDEETKQRELSKIEKRINEKLPSSATDALKAWRRIAMLFNPKTQVRNVVGNTVIMPVNVVGDAIGTQIDKAISKVTGVRTTNYTDFNNIFQGAKKGLKDAITDYKTGTRTTPTGSKYEFEFGAKPFNENTDSKTLNAINNKLNGINDLLSAVMSGGDRPFYEAAYKNSLEGQMKANNVEVPTQDMIDIAVNEALSRTWNDNNNYTQAVLGIRKYMNKINIKGFGLGDLIIPFAKTPANLTKAMVEYSPAGFIGAYIDGNNLKNAISRGEFTPQQQKAFVNSTSKAIAGTILYAIAGTLVKSGIITGSKDDDKDVANFEQNVLGIQPYSIKIGDKTYTYSWANPINAPLAIMADTYKMSKEGTSNWQILRNAFKVAGDTLIDNSFLQGIKELFDDDGISEGLIKSVESFPASLIPTLFSQMASAFDNTRRNSYEYKNEKDSTINGIKYKIPGLRNQLTESVNTFGETIENQNNPFDVFLSPANVREAKTTETQNQLYSLYQETKDKTIFPRQAPNYFAYGDEKVTLTSKDKATFQKAEGQYASEQLEGFFNSEYFNKLENKDKIETIDKMLKDSVLVGKASIGTETDDYKKLKEKTDKLEKNGIALVDYYNAYMAQKDAEGQKDAKGKTISGTKKKAQIQAVNNAVGNNLTNKQKNVLYEIFNID